MVVECSYCLKCTFICEGDAICSLVDADPVLVLENHHPTGAYMWCDGDQFDDGE